jgi:hypothetical protein
MRTTSSPGPTAEVAVETTRQLIQDPCFCARHRTQAKHFSRRRCLTFANVVVLLAQKTVRSIQLHLSDFFRTLHPEAPAVTPAAWCEARLKLRHTAFLELNQRAIVEPVYGDQSSFAVRRWQGHRLLGMDSSLIRLPAREQIGQEFGWVECGNQQGQCGRYPQGRLSALTDVLNRIVIEARFVPWNQGERELAIAHVAAMAPEDVGILDRGYAGYEVFAHFVAAGRSLVCRCAASGFGVVNQLFAANVAGRSVVSQLHAPAKQRQALRQVGLPEVITLRFVTVRLSTGELEVLATNLLDEQRYATQAFGSLYHYRWGIETYYGLIKGRLDLEHFTGWSPEAVRQDVQATIFLSNLESILTRPAHDQLQEQSQPLMHRQQVNHAVSFHAVKSRIIELLLSQEPISQVLQRLQQCFLHNPVAVRPGRKAPRKTPSAWRSYHYHRNTRKSLF